MNGDKSRQTVEEYRKNASLLSLAEQDKIKKMTDWELSQRIVEENNQKLAADLRKDPCPGSPRKTTRNWPR